MKPEHLESLLLDRALGQLAPEVAALLEAHLARDIIAAKRAAGLQATVALAGNVSAVAQAPAAIVAADAWQRIHRDWRWRRAGLEFLKIAAGVAIGLGLAFGWQVRPIAPATVMALTPPQREAQPPPTFWSTARLVANVRHERIDSVEDMNRPQYRWLAPAKRSLGEGKQ